MAFFFYKLERLARGTHSLCVSVRSMWWSRRRHWLCWWRAWIVRAVPHRARDTEWQSRTCHGCKKTTEFSWWVSIKIHRELTLVKCVVSFRTMSGSILHLHAITHMYIHGSNLAYTCTVCHQTVDVLAKNVSPIFLVSQEITNHSVITADAITMIWLMDGNYFPSDSPILVVQAHQTRDDQAISGDRGGENLKQIHFHTKWWKTRFIK